MDELRVCKKCGEEKSIDEYYLRKYKSGNYGYMGSCKECEREIARKYNSSEKQKEYYNENKTRRIEATRRWQDKNKDKVAETTKAYRTKNKDKMTILCREWARNNKDKVRLRRNKRRAYKLQAQVIGYAYDKQDIINLFYYQEGLCVCCGSSLHDYYELDHIYPLVHGGKDSIMNIQLLCKSCNCIKGSKLPEDFRVYLRTNYPERYEYYVVQQHGINEGINFN